MTFKELCQLEPRLRELERDIRKHTASERRKPVRCANAAWYAQKGFKERLCEMVGWDRTPVGYERKPSPTKQRLERERGKFLFLNMQELTTICDEEKGHLDDFLDTLPAEQQDAHDALCNERAYDVAYDYLYALLPSCRDCLCM